MAVPVIGISSYLERAKSGVWDAQAVFLPWAYAAPVVAAGGAVSVLPPQPPTPDAVAGVLSSIDGLYLAGGYDVDPATYGAEPHAETDEPRRDRDAWEAALFDGACGLGLPVLGVCRGAQLINVARGGTLVQHLPDRLGHTGYQGGDAVYRRVGVTVSEGSLLATMHPREREVPMYHHQAIDRLGSGLTVSAVSIDGVIEAVEDPSLAFCVAVQFHPERDDLTGIWDAFVAAAAAYRKARS
ncbi:MAG: gamma-glutamyl-gamma-aminobutyrate hydrolase family protein [Demequina sp.]|nr:gamma-glutamyl-gamma-aminobutyrate hydrolase family protein [Demequina sp.]